jgi:hypothetical protein
MIHCHCSHHKKKSLVVVIDILLVAELVLMCI